MKRTALSEFCAQFADSEPPDVVRIGRRWFYDPRRLKTYTDGQGWEAFSAGIFLGEERQPFRPTPALLDLVRTNQRVVVTEEAAWLVICGKDVLMEGVLDAGDFAPGSRVLIADREENVLGYGEVKASFDKRAKHRLFVKTLLDRGDYLRRERG